MSALSLLVAARSIAAAAILVGCAAAVGRTLLTRLLRVQALRGELWLLGAGVGLGLCGTIVYGLGLAGLATAWAVRGLLLCLLVAAGVTLVLDRGSVRDADHAVVLPAEHARFPAWTLVLVVAAGFLLACACFSCLSPMVDYDGLSYHVAAPKRWIEIGAVRPLPTHLHTEWPMGFEMLYLLLLPVSGPDGCKILVGATAALTSLTVYFLGRRIASVRVGAAAAALTLIAAGADKINTTSIEFSLALFVTLAALALAVRQSAAGAARLRWLVVAGICAGFANCTKLNGLLSTAVLSVAVATVADKTPRPWTRRAGEASLFAAISILTAMPWYLRAWIDTGNPVFPFGWPILGGRFWDSDAAHNLTLYFRTFDLPGATLAARHAVWLKHLIRLVVVTGIAAALPSPRPIRFAVVFAGLFALLQIAGSDQPRFFLPALPFAALFCAWWLVRLADRWPAAGWLCAAAAGVIALPPAARSAWSDAPIVLGMRAREPYLSHYVNVLPACRWANSNLPPGARVLFGLDTRTFFLERDAFWSNSIVQRRFRYDQSPEQLLASLQSEGVEYLLYNRALLKGESVQFERTYLGRDWETAGLEALAQESELLWSENSVSLYKLPSRSGEMRPGQNRGAY